jgi:hypothetical protein
LQEGERPRNATSSTPWMTLAVANISKQHPRPSPETFWYNSQCQDHKEPFLLLAPINEGPTSSPERREVMTVWGELTTMDLQDRSAICHCGEDLFLLFWGLPPKSQCSCSCRLSSWLLI